jgi:hypothetical protein
MVVIDGRSFPFQAGTTARMDRSSGNGQKKNLTRSRKNSGWCSDRFSTPS